MNCEGLVRASLFALPLVLSSGVVGVACESKESEASARDTVPQKSRRKEELSLPKSAGKSLEPKNNAPKNPLEKEMLKVLKKGREASQAGATSCESAYRGIEAMAKMLASKTDVEAKLPQEGVFVRECEKLPEEAQRCLVTEHSATHRDECNKIHDRYKPQLDAFHKAVLVQEKK